MPDWALLVLCGIVAVTNLGALWIDRQNRKDRR